MEGARKGSRHGRTLGTSMSSIEVSEFAPALGGGFPSPRTCAVELGRPWVPSLDGPSGSPFQMPARLAVGLGLGSAPGHGYPFRAPRPRFFRPGMLGPPCHHSGRSSDFGERTEAMCPDCGYGQVLRGRKCASERVAAKAGDFLHPSLTELGVLPARHVAQLDRRGMRLYAGNPLWRQLSINRCSS